MKQVLTQLGVYTSSPVAFLVLILYAVLWYVFKPETFEWHAGATLATWAMTLVIQRAEHRAVPRGHLPQHDEHAVAPIEPGAEQVCPARGVLRDVGERSPVDDPLAVDVRDALAERVARTERLDDVAGEVEPRGNVPSRWERAGARNVTFASAAKHHDSSP